MSEGSDRRRSSGYDDATAGGMITSQRLGMVFPTYMNIYCNSYKSSCLHSQRQELTEHTVVCPRCHRRQVAVTVVVHTIGTLRPDTLNRFMQVNRRQHQHWHKHCQ